MISAEAPDLLTRVFTTGPTSVILLLSMLSYDVEKPISMYSMTMLSN